MATINNIKKRAAEIKDAYEPESVTAEKVGQLFEDIADVTEQTITSSEEVMQESVRAATQAAQAAEDASGYLADLQKAIADLPDGQAVSATVAEHTLSIGGLEDATNLGSDGLGNNYSPSDVLRVKESAEYVEVKTDSQGYMLWTLGKDGRYRINLPVDFLCGAEGVEDARLEGFYRVESPEWNILLLDSENNIAFGIKKDGKVVISGIVEAELSEKNLEVITNLIKKEYDEEIQNIKAGLLDPLDKYVSLSCGISQADIENGTSKYDEIRKASSNENMSIKACSVLYNLMKLEKDNRFVSTFFEDIDFRNDLRERGYTDKFRTNNGDGTYSPKQPDTFTLETFSHDNSGKRQMLYIADFRWFTDTHGYSASRRSELRAIMLSIMAKAWIDYKMIPVMCWHEGNPYTPIAFSGNGYNYTYDQGDYPQNHRYVIKEILEQTEYGVSDGSYPSDNNTICGFDTEHPTGAFASPYRWFDAKCQEVGQFIQDLYELAGEEFPLIIRLWHECEDDWQWWGSSMTEVEDYKAFFRLTVDKLKEYSESNSLLFGYCPDRYFKTSAAKNRDTYEIRYAGDDYVDIVGYDDYAIGRPGQIEEGIMRMRVVSSFAKNHGKPAFVFESGNTPCDYNFFETWVSVFNTAGVNFSAWMGWQTVYPPYMIHEETEQRTRLMHEFSQFFKRSNMPCVEENFDLTTINNNN